MTRERRVLPAELRLVPGDGPLPAITGYSAVFGQETDLGAFRERVRAGAFTSTLAADDVVAMENHDPNLAFARKSAGNLQLGQDSRGLRMTAQPIDTQQARDMVERIRTGVLRGQSFGFETLVDSWTGMDRRELVEVRLFDVSVVTFPAYLTTDVGLVGVRSAPQMLLQPQAELREASGGVYVRAMTAMQKATCTTCGQPVGRTGNIVIDWRRHNGAGEVIASRCGAHLERRPAPTTARPRAGAPARAARQADSAGARADEAARLGAAIDLVETAYEGWVGRGEVRAIRAQRHTLALREANRRQAVLAATWVQRRREALRT